MSSRALRKLQREREQQKQQEESNQDAKSEAESEKDEAPAAKSQAPNAFSMLSAIDDDANDVSEKESELSEKDEEATPHPVEQINEPTKPKKKSKKSKKRKGKGVEQPVASAKEAQTVTKKPELDEIDLALQSLSTKTNEKGTVDPSALARAHIDEANSALFRLLAVESKHLNALNEMKRLFGSVVLENEDETVEGPRRRGRGPQQLDLGGALAARNSPASRGQGLTGLALKRNPFIQGKEEWPKATAGGLSMELVENFDDGTVEYRYVHNTIYQDVQRQFETCVESMNPQRMIALLQYNPYHISTLLQVSEIAKQQGDHSVSGDLLERALFSFGRASQSSFNTAISEGKARFDFRRPENREFWLAAWRYITNLGQRGTWRTGYEWAKLLLSLDPEGDPYCIALVIDQIAIRGGQSEDFLNLANVPFFSDLWATRPNIHISAALGEYKTKQAQKSRESLTRAIHRYPWIHSRLFQVLGTGHVPKSIWGKKPQYDRQNFDSELYAHNAKDLWNTPEAVAFLVEVAESANDSVKAGDNSASGANPITQDEARHVLLSGVPSLINLIPRKFTTMSSSSSDPLPPPDNLPSYTIAPAEGPRIYDSPHEENNLGLAREPELPAFHDDTPPSEETPNPRSPEDPNSDIAQAQQFQGVAGFFRRFFQAATPGNAPNAAELDHVLQVAAEQGVPGDFLATQRAALEEGMEWGGEDTGATTQGSDGEGAIPNRLHAPTIDDVPDEDDQPSSGSQQSSAAHIGPPEPYDDERNQRWLAGQGMLRLKAFTDRYDTEEAKWEGASGEERKILEEYARRVLQLKQQRTRDWILDFMLVQGAGGEVRKLVGREVERVRRG